MPLPVAHGLMGASIVAAVRARPGRRRFVPLLVGAGVANMADLDFFLVFIFHSKAWHRGFSHSITLALAVCLVLLLWPGARRAREALAYGLAFASHGILDYLTTKEGGGVELLWPFSSERLVCGWVGLSEWPSRLTPVQIAEALVVEFMIFAPLLILVLHLRKYLRKGACELSH